MVRCKYVPCHNKIRTHYGHGLPHFRGTPIYQHGQGLGGLFNLVRGVFPILKPIAKTIGKQVVRTGMNIAKDVVRGTNFKTALKRRGVQAIKSSISQLVSPNTTQKPKKRQKKHYNKASKKRKTIPHDILS